MTNQPKVSVIVPAYNAMKYLPETLDSILKQTFTNFEVLIINDGSSDNIIEWCTQITDPRVKLISQQNMGLSSARNTGIKYSQGEYIALLDSDDTWVKTKLAKQVEFFKNHPSVDLVHTWIELMNEQSISTGRILKSSAEGNVWQQLLQQNAIACLSVMVRRHCFETVGGFDEKLRSLEDWDMWIRIAINYKFGVIKEPLAFYRQIPTSMSKNYQVMAESFDLVIEKAFSTVSADLIYLKNYSCASANICLGWKALQSEAQNLEQANFFRVKAAQHYPKIRFSQEYIRLSLAIFVMSCLGVNNYSRFLEIAYSARGLFSKVIDAKLIVSK
jgi:glycosyltransferase involved in cell wall biosynthesis